MSDLNPCMTCGACCAYFRVSFYWAEADDAGGLVPSHLTEPVSPFLRCMCGTNQRHSRCVALEGEPGERVRCGIYENRPSPCREFMMSGEGGITNDACNRARAKYGLPPLHVSSPPFIESLSGATAPPSRVQSRVEF
ncbi:YkgJ family cysteine cluster protein [Enterobacter sp. R1(2018)]|uniref:YkgJ family cysteine cluster protein n=1 Tax=Enterobacter sp. R1(2018) TaxID=2447891 RepID=UPI000EB1C9B2|nr:YkgJ family cysteine cluster protein [Enterobacter sp. R1(2018)]RKQ38100.1 YkgJ family cysteine cluster protein [Enterobacter sp. R1(2018)]